VRVTFITCRRIIPPKRTTRSSTGDCHSQTNMYFDSAISRQLTTVQLQELCRHRTTLKKNKLKTAGIARPPHQMINLLTDNCPPLVFPFSDWFLLDSCSCSQRHCQEDCSCSHRRFAVTGIVFFTDDSISLGREPRYPWRCSHFRPRLGLDGGPNRV